MNEKNHSDVGNAMNFILRPMLAGFVAQKLSKSFGKNNWWAEGVLEELRPEQKKFLPLDGSYAELTDKMDIPLCALLISIHWEEVFSKILPYDYFSWIKELRTIRNRWAHEQESFDDESTIRALDTMALVCKNIDEDATEQLRIMWRNKLHGENKPIEIILPPEKISSTNFGDLKSWRYLIEPHPDVAMGRYRQAEFALNLADIVRKNGMTEYVDPIEFFSRTYLTDGLKNLLVETLKRLTNGDGEPVIQLKTSFGGGKSHSLLALYHLFGGIKEDQSEAVDKILKAAEIKTLPKVHTAVIVGTWENPLKSTLWGEIAAQLSRSTGNPELYEMMRENDKRGVSPGVELLQKLFDKAGACLILIDELVAYGRKLSLGEIENGGSFGNLMSFIQELTEAAKASSKTAVVVSIPESDAEIVDDLGRQVLQQVERVFGRMEFVWTPVSVHEGYEIVRRRLFKTPNDKKAIENVCTAFFNMYLNNTNDFPYESRQTKYREKLLACYPIHPQFFDYLYDKWTSLDGFQKTRGVLRLMAKIIYELWRKNDNSLLIMPCNIPLYSSPVRDELVKLLKGNWDAIVNGEIDGDDSKPYELDLQNARFARLQAAKKISRSIFIGTAPNSRKGDVRGIEENEIHLSTIQPTEIDSVAIFNDALTKLKSNLYYLYSQNTRLWFGVNPTLRKLVDDKCDKFSDDEIDFEIEKRVRTWQGRSLFKSIHVCPTDSNDVIDKQTARLVILPPKFFYDDRLKENPAMEFAKKILDTCGRVPRKYKNMLLFLSADSDKMAVLKKSVREYKAWSEVKKEADFLNLDRVQLMNVKSNLETTEKTFAMKISQAYCKIFVPDTFGDADLNNLKWHIKDINCTTEDNISATSKKFREDEKLLDSLGSDRLKNLLDKFIWHDEDFVELNRLWEYFTMYYYLPRLIDIDVLLETVKKGVKTKVFALTEKMQEGEKFDLKFGDNFFGQVSKENFLVKKSFAEKQLADENENNSTENEETSEEEKKNLDSKKTETESKQKDKKLSKYFYMDVELDKTRLTKSFNACMEEVVSNLMNLPNVKTSIKLSVSVSASEGIPSETKESVAANCRSLKIENFYFEE